MPPDLNAVSSYLLALQDDICGALEREDGGARFTEDRWSRPADAPSGLGGGGRSRILENGPSSRRPASASPMSPADRSRLPPRPARPELAGKAFHAMGVSLVIHPHNPYVPTSTRQRPLLHRRRG